MTKREMTGEILGGMLFFGCLFVITWIAFGLDVITTGM
jgi:hypothetical protein